MRAPHRMHEAALALVEDGQVGYVGHHTEKGFYLYTYGRAAQGLPELVVFGEDHATALSMLRCGVAEGIAEPGTYEYAMPEEHVGELHHGFAGSLKARKLRRKLELEYVDLIGGGDVLELVKVEHHPVHLLQHQRAHAPAPLLGGM